MEILEKKVVSKLRFKDENGNDYPDWEDKKLGEIANFLDGRRKPIKSSDRSKRRGKYPYYGASGIIDYVNDYIFDEDLILLGEDGENIVSRNLPLAFRVSSKCWVNNHAHVIVPKKGVEINFLTYSLEKIDYAKYNTGTAQPKLNQAVCREIPLNLPSLPEQQKIADFLTSVDDKIEHLTKKKELLTTYKKGMMQKLFSQELRFKDENGNEYPEWRNRRLDEFSQINPKTKKLPSSFFYIDLESVVKGRLIKKERINIDEAPSRAQRLLNRGDIIFQMVRPYQSNNFFFNLEGDYVASTGYAQIKSNENQMFIFQLFHSYKFLKKVILRCTGTSYPAINSSDLKSISLALPFLPEQQKIADFLTEIDNKIGLVTTQKENTKQFKKGLLQQMFV